MKTIRISDAVHDYIAARGRFQENHDDVLRRLFKLPPLDARLSSVPSNVLSNVPTVATSDSLNLDSEEYGLVPKKRTRRDFSTKEMKARVIEKTLYVTFEHQAPKSWELPANKDDKIGIRRVRDLAGKSAEENGATQGQLNAIGKAMSDAGYYLTGPRKRKR